MNKVKMNLVGLDGNAFALMSAFRQNAKRQGWKNEEIEAVMKECMRVAMIIFLIHWFRTQRS